MPIDIQKHREALAKLRSYDPTRMDDDEMLTVITEFVDSLKENYPQVLDEIESLRAENAELKKAQKS